MRGVRVYHSAMPKGPVLLVASLFLLISSALAQNKLNTLPKACGPNNVSFDARLDKSPHSLTPPEPGKARIYFLQNIAVSGDLSTATGPIMFGVDGAWAGAIHGAAYFSISVDPGEHHICAASRYFYRVAETGVLALAHFQAEAGRSYYYRLRLGEYPELEPVDSDEGEFVIPSYPLSIFSPKK
jgi:hypothetical protein